MIGEKIASPLEAGKIPLADTFYYLGLGMEEEQDASILVNVRRVKNGAPRSWAGWD